MKLFLKLVILGIAAFFVFDYSLSHNIYQHYTPHGGSDPSDGRDIARMLAVKDKAGKPVLQEKEPVLQRRNSFRTPMTPEMRKKMEEERNANVAWLKDMTQRYSPDSWFMLMQYDKLPSSSEIDCDDGSTASSEKSAETFHFLKGRTRIDFLVSMEKNVHEIAHCYFDQNVYRYLRDNNLKMTRGNVCGFIFVSPAKTYYISFPEKDLFPSHDLTAVIPKNLRTYRFDTYIEGSTSTQSDGVIGLLNELHAYYLGSKFCYEMLEPYKKAAGTDAEGLFEWVTNIQSTMSAYYEFDFFIREYLLFMKKNYPANYAMLKSYRPFAESYSTIRHLYTGLIDRYQESIQGQVKLLNSSDNAIARVEKGWLWVRAGRSNVSSGTPLFSKERETLTPVLNSRRYKEIDEDFLLP